MSNAQITDLYNHQKSSTDNQLVLVEAAAKDKKTQSVEIGLKKVPTKSQSEMNQSMLQDDAFSKNLNHGYKRASLKQEGQTSSVSMQIVYQNSQEISQKKADQESSENFQINSVTNALLQDNEHISSKPNEAIKKSQ